MSILYEKDAGLPRKADAIDMVKYIGGSMVFGGIAGGTVGYIVYKIRGGDELSTNIATVLTLVCATIGGVIGGCTAKQEASNFAQKHPTLDRAFEMSAENLIVGEGNTGLNVEESESKSLETAPEEECLMQSMPC